MFSDEKKKKIGDLKFNIKLEYLKEVEEYILQVFKKRNIKFSYDCWFNEELKFQTLNYTDFLGGIWISPLQQYVTNSQLVDALVCDSNLKYDYVDFFKKNLENASKYELDVSEVPDVESLILLPGSNILKKNIDKNKILKALQNEKTFIKPHPLTDEKDIDLLKTLTDNVLPTKMNIYNGLFQRANNIYSAHSSETFFYSIISGKNLVSVEFIANIDKSGFFPLNNFFYLVDGDKLLKINKVFNSYKSGYIHPIINPDWKNTIDRYLDYIIHKQRMINS